MFSLLDRIKLQQGGPEQDSQPCGHVGAGLDSRAGFCLEPLFHSGQLVPKQIADLWFMLHVLSALPLCCRFGLLGMRVFNTLLHQGQLEPKQIADFIMREHKETRELLYRMFKAGYLQMQVSGD